MADIKQSVVTEVVINNKQATKAINDQEKAQNDLSNSTKKATLETENATGAIDDMAGALGLNLGAMKSAQGGIKGMVKGFKTLKISIAATGIGVLVIALAGLVTLFSKSQSGAEFFRKATAALSTTFGLLIDGAESLVDLLVDVFSKPQESLKKLTDSIKDGVVYYFSEFIPNAITKVIDGFGLLGKAAKLIFEGEFAKAADVAGEAVLKLGDGLTDLNPITSGFKVVVEGTVNGIKNLVDVVDKATTAGFKLEDALIANEKALADQQVAAAKSIASQKELNLIVEDTTKTTEERVAAAEEFGRVESEQITKQLKLQTARLAILKAQNDITESNEEDLQRVRDQEIVLANLRAASLEREVTNNNKLNTIKTAAAAQQKVLDDAALARTTTAEEKLVLANEMEEIRLANQIEDATLQAEALLRIEEDRYIREQALAKGNKAELDLIEFNHQTKVIKIKEKSAKITAKIRAAEEKNNEKSYKNERAIAGTAFAELGGLIKDNAVSSAVINIANGVTAALALGPIVGIPTIPGIIATGLAQLGIIKSVETVKAEDGMMIQGASHLNGGVNVMTPNGMIEAEGGEFIMNKLSTAMFKDELSAISQAGGGVPLAQRGLLIEGASSSSSLRNLSSDISGSVNNVQTVLVTEDLTAVQSRVSVTEQISTL